VTFTHEDKAFFAGFLAGCWLMGMFWMEAIKKRWEKEDRDGKK